MGIFAADQGAAQGGLLLDMTSAMRHYQSNSQFLQSIIC
jgi:hypothetical protein